MDLFKDCKTKDEVSKRMFELGGMGAYDRNTVLSLAKKRMEELEDNKDTLRVERIIPGKFEVAYTESDNVKFFDEPKNVNAMIVNHQGVIMFGVI